MTVLTRGQINLILLQDGVGISSLISYYYISSSSEELCDGTWLVTPPQWVNEKYIWSKTIITYTDDTTKESLPICLSGSKGESGIGIHNFEQEYYRSTSKIELVDGDWNTNVPQWSIGIYIWTRMKITYSNNMVKYTAPICDSSWDAVNVMEHKITEEYTALMNDIKGDLSNHIQEIERIQESTVDRLNNLEEWKLFADDQITPEAIINTVSAGYYNKDEIENMYTSKEEFMTEIEQVIKNIDTTLNATSGSNLLLNSSGWNATNFWEGIKGKVESLKDDDILDNTLSNSAFYLENGSMYQDLELVIGKIYTISCKMRKSMNACSLKVIQDDNSESILFAFNDNELDEEWHAYEMTFECLSPMIKVLVSSSAKSMIIADIMLNEGEKTKTWTSNIDEIYAENVYIDKKGIEVKQRHTDTRTRINDAEFAVIYEKTGEPVMRVFEDTTMLYKGIVEDSLAIGCVKMTKRSNGLDLAVIDE